MIYINQNSNIHDITIACVLAKESGANIRICDLAKANSITPGDFVVEKSMVIQNGIIQTRTLFEFLLKPERRYVSRVVVENIEKMNKVVALISEGNTEEAIKKFILILKSESKLTSKELFEKAFKHLSDIKEESLKESVPKKKKENVKVFAKKSDIDVVVKVRKKFINDYTPLPMHTIIYVKQAKNEHAISNSKKRQFSVFSSKKDLINYLEKEGYEIQ